MNQIFQFNQYLLKRQVFALAGTFRVFDPSGRLLLFSQQKMFKLREDIRVFADEAKTREVLAIKARQIIDFSAAFDVIDSATGQKVGNPSPQRIRIHAPRRMGDTRRERQRARKTIRRQHGARPPAATFCPG